MRLIKGMRQEHADAIADAVAKRGPFDSIDALWRVSGVPVATLRRLAQADAFNSMGLDRQAALWQVRELRDEPLPLFDGRCEEDSERSAETPSTGAMGKPHAFCGLPVQATTTQPSARVSSRTRLPMAPQETITLPPISLPRKVVHDYASVGLSLKAHPISFIRERLNEMGVTPAIALRDEDAWPHGRPIVVAGLVLVRQRPGTASGVVFVTLEDETDVSNLIIRPRVFERDRRAARHATVMLARGRIERQGQVVHVMTQQVQDVSRAVTDLIARSRDFR